VLFALEIVFALYAISFVWFWSLCSLSIPSKHDASDSGSASNIIPFERGLEMQERKRTGT
jgi:hypothetical protein